MTGKRQSSSQYSREMIVIAKTAEESAYLAFQAKYLEKFCKEERLRGR